jgi:hypothetical protein
MEKHLRGQILIQYVNQQMMVRKFSLALEQILAPSIDYTRTKHYFSASHLWSSPHCVTPIQSNIILSAEEEISLEEEEAYEIWQNIPDEERTSHLDVIPNPDGVMIRPSHHHVDISSIQHKQTTTTSLSPCELQMKRDPSLLNFDNVSRVDIAEIHTISSWDKPVIITNAVVPETQVPKTILNKQELKALYGNVKVRTGNRETLIDNGFMNSIPKRLADALEETNNTNTNNTECGTIVFSPIQELPDTFIDELRELTDAFPSFTNSDTSIGRKKKFTLTIASEGFGIGMHKHNAAMFMLLVGQKKWYMTNSSDLDGIVSESETHPRFYRELSSHKCIQQPGEVLYVPNDWYHEIFNLEYTLGIQALPE